MPNPFFEFKQFTIHQQEAALKVCTEACLFGALLPAQHRKHVLDIGTGTGLLALMIAQRSSEETTIEAVELDLPSCRDARQNFGNSPWSRRLILHEGNIKQFRSTSSFDLIVCNPPFFIDQLKSPERRTNVALHGSELKPEDLPDLVHGLIAPEGLFFVLLPETEMNKLTALLEAQGWHTMATYHIYQTAEKNIFRQVKGFSLSPSALPLVEEKIIVYEADRSYTETFKALLKEYYLYL